VKCANGHYWAYCGVHREELVPITEEQDGKHHDKEKKTACICGKKRKRDSDEVLPNKKPRVDAAYGELLQLEEDEIAAIANPVVRALLTALVQELKKTGN
jgi:hypothetical protein